MILAAGILASASAVSTQSQDIFDDIAEWFETDFVDFWEDDFVGAFEDLGKWFETDFVDFWEEDFVDFFTDDIPEFFTETLPEGLEVVGKEVLYFVTLGNSDAVIDWFENDAADALTGLANDAADAFTDMTDWFSGDFVDFFENDFVDFWEEDFVEFWEVDFVEFWTEDLPDFFSGLWHQIELPTKESKVPDLSAHLIEPLSQKEK